eukprot:1799891-Rhodomonas_salina.1
MSRHLAYVRYGQKASVSSRPDIGLKSAPDSAARTQRNGGGCYLRRADRHVTPRSSSRPRTARPAAPSTAGGNRSCRARSDCAQAAATSAQRSTPHCLTLPARSTPITCVRHATSAPHTAPHAPTQTAARTSIARWNAVRAHSLVAPRQVSTGHCLAGA